MARIHNLRRSRAEGQICSASTDSWLKCRANTGSSARSLTGSSAFITRSGTGDPASTRASHNDQ